VGHDVQAELRGGALAGQAGPGRVVGRQARALGVAGDRAALGVRQVLDSQRWHCQRLRVRHDDLDAVQPGRARSRLWRTSRLTSPMMCTGECRNRSNERATTPSVEFSTATTPNCAVPAAVAWNTSSKLWQ
jgi:hypothetical protein